METTLRVFSIFTSIQGESTYAGLPCVFVRLAGCPLACVYCDTQAARSAVGEALPISAIVQRALRGAPSLVEVTGGEPLAQPGTHALLRALADQGCRVLLETSGAFSIAAIDPRVVVFMGIKTPGSRMAHRFCAENIAVLSRPGHHHQVKFVVTDQEDFKFACQMAAQHRLADHTEMLISPVAGLDPAQVAEWILASSFPFRLQLQLHRLIWPHADRDGIER